MIRKMMLSTALVSLCGLLSVCSAGDSIQPGGGPRITELPRSLHIIGMEAGVAKNLVVLGSAKSADLLSSTLVDLAVDNKDYTQVLTYEKNAYRLDYSNMAVGEVEAFNFSHAYALSLAHLGLGTGCTSASTAKNHYESIIKLISDYEARFSELACNPGTRGKIDNHLLNLYSFAGQAHSGLYQLYNISSDTQVKAKKSMRSAIDYYEKAILSVKSKSRELREMPIVHQMKANLINAYFAAYQMYYSEGLTINLEPCEKRMRTLYKQLKGTESLTFGKKTLNALELFQASNNTSRKGEPLADYKDIRAAKNRQALAEMAVPAGTMRTLEDRVNHMYQQIQTTINVDAQEAILDIKKRRIGPNQISLPCINQIFDLENEIFTELGSSSSSASPITRMSSIYRNYIDIMGFARVSEALNGYLMLFMCVGDLDNALLRTLAFESILKERSEVLDFKMNLRMAYIKALNGDYEDFLILVEDAEEKRATKAARQKARQEDRHAEMVSTIQKAQKDHQERTLTEEEKRERDKAKRKAKQARQKERGKLAAVVGATDDTDTISGVSISSAQEKEDKLARHMANKLLRAEEQSTEAMTVRPDTSRMSALERPSASERDDRSLLDGSHLKATSFSAEEKQRQENELSDSLQSTYGFSGVALHVNESIRNNTWDFTRDQLKTYYEEMGCTSRAGKGSHDKIQLPKSVIFTHGEEVVTITSDLGGALTLPDWDGFVPHYLRKQIQCAREKLRAR